MQPCYVSGYSEISNYFGRSLQAYLLKVMNEKCNILKTLNMAEAKALSPREDLGLNGHNYVPWKVTTFQSIPYSIFPVIVRSTTRTFVPSCIEKCKPTPPRLSGLCAGKDIQYIRPYLFFPILLPSNALHCYSWKTPTVLPQYLQPGRTTPTLRASIICFAPFFHGNDIST